MEAIRRAFQFIRISTRRNKKFAIFCDSKSVLESIDDQDSKNPIMIDILDDLQNFTRRGISVMFCWIPSHIGIDPGNDRADEAAQSAIDDGLPNVTHKLPYSDFVPNVRQLARQMWQDLWSREVNNKLHVINPDIKPYHTQQLKRKDEVILHRIRIGHTRLTHGYLMEGGRYGNPPLCRFCSLTQISIKHLLLDCSRFREIRSHHFDASCMQDLFDRINPVNIIGFLLEAKLYDFL